MNLFPMQAGAVMGGPPGEMVLTLDLETQTSLCVGGLEDHMKLQKEHGA